MPNQQRQPSTLEATASILGALGGIGCLSLFIVFWLLLSGIIVYAFLGAKGALVVGVILIAIVLAVVDKVRKQRRLWRCPRCGGTFQPFQGPSALCPHCRITVTPPPAGSPIAPSAAAPTEERATMTCPDCAETILATARRCRYCGYTIAT